MIMNKYFGIIIKEGSLLISKAPMFYRNYFMRKKISSEKRYQDLRKVVLRFNQLMHTKIILTGLKTLPCEQSFVLTPNHQSFMDSVTFIELLEQKSTFVAKKESKKYLLIGKAIGSIDGLFLDRDNLRQEIELMKQVRQSLKTENRKWVIFPEGTRSKNEDHALNEFKAGSFKMAMSSGVDIYPVATWGSFRILDPKENRFKQYPVYIHIFNPIKKEEYQKMTTQELSNKVQTMIESKLPELKKLDEETLNLYLKKKYRK